MRRNLALFILPLAAALAMIASNVHTYRVGLPGRLDTGVYVSLPDGHSVGYDPFLQEFWIDGT